MTAHDVIARIARQILRERYASIEDQADAMAAAIITELELTEDARRTSCTIPTCPWSYGCGHDGTQRRFATPWVTDATEATE